jgi:hypothetical protein
MELNHEDNVRRIGEYAVRRHLEFKLWSASNVEPVWELPDETLSEVQRFWLTVSLIEQAIVKGYNVEARPAMVFALSHDGESVDDTYVDLLVAITKRLLAAATELYRRHLPQPPPKGIPEDWKRTALESLGCRLDKRSAWWLAKAHLAVLDASKGRSNGGTETTVAARALPSLHDLLTDEADRRGISHEDLAGDWNISRATYFRAKTRNLASQSTLRKLAKGFGCSIDDLLRFRSPA